MNRTLLLLTLSVLSPGAVRADDVDFVRDIAPILRSNCINCHNHETREGELDLSSSGSILAGGDSGAAIAPGDPDASLLIEYVSGDEPLMPQSGSPLTTEQIQALRKWITDGADWPDGLLIEIDPRDWWSLRSLEQPDVPDFVDEPAVWTQNPIDAFVAAKHDEIGLRHSPEADRRTLIRRLYFDLVGLPPDPGDIDEFVNDPNPRAFEALVDRLLDSPRYGERWARHWLDVVHYGDTHGYDKDKLRLNAWPYRDYVIRSFNSDKSYAQFIREQIAGDVLFPDSPDGVIATGFIAAGPWDFISHVEVPETKIDGQIARSIDRDDMVRTVMETFCSVTVGCARCHEHKFDPITQQDYYNLQTVFAAVDRAERTYDSDPQVFQRRRDLLARQQEFQSQQTALDTEVRRLAGDSLAEIDARISALVEQNSGEKRPEFGYHSQIESDQEVTKWVQVDLGEPVEIERIVTVGCHDDFNGIGAGFGYPDRYRVEASNDPEFQTNVLLIADYTESDVPNPGVVPVPHAARVRPDSPAIHVRYVRVTATNLTLRQNDYIFALAELQVFTPDGANVAAGKPVTALDSIEAPVRWRKSNLVDGYYYGVDVDAEGELASLQAEREVLIQSVMSSETRAALRDVEEQLASVEASLAELPPPQTVYAAASDFAAQGNFKPTGGAPREIRVLHRGNILDPGELAMPAGLAVLDDLAEQFKLPESHSEGQRRAAMADWISHPENPLTWRAIVNRVWQYHFGRGLCDTPNDLGRMGEEPTHTELLDWLAVHVRDNDGSLKDLHRLICTSATYRQTSRHTQHATLNTQLDNNNRYLWRMNRRRLEAEAVRDAVLSVAGKLDLTMYGPGFQDFVIEHPEHSPHYEYHLHDPEDPRAHRRSVYRFIVRSQQQPFMTTLDCADPSMQVDKRNETVTPLQALALLNNNLMVAMSAHFAERVAESNQELHEQLAAAFRIAIGREAADEELLALTMYAEEHGLDNTCRLIFNLNEFVFVD